MKPPWLIRAIGEMGVEELAGDAANPRIIDYFSETTLKATSDEISWCAAFVCWCLERTWIPSTNSARARSYLDWGVPLGKPIQGCVTILSRGSNPDQGHVGFYWSEDLEQVYLLGGNQLNKVCIKGYPKEHVLGYRMPEDDFWIGKNEPNPSRHIINS